MSNRSAAAEALATRAHAGQVRKRCGDPYIVHPRRVAARIAARFPEDHDLIAAAWCHDVIEDCAQISEDDLLRAIGPIALAIVREVSNPSRLQKDLPRAERKALDRAHLSTISRPARCLKLVDRIDNLRDGCRLPDCAWLATYVSESRLLAEALHGSDPLLERELAEAIANAEAVAHAGS